MQNYVMYVCDKTQSKPFLAVLQKLAREAYRKTQCLVKASEMSYALVARRVNHLLSAEKWFFTAINDVVSLFDPMSGPRISTLTYVKG